MRFYWIRMGPISKERCLYKRKERKVWRDTDMRVRMYTHTHTHTHRGKSTM